MSTGKQAVAVDDAVCGYGWFGVVGADHGPADHSGGEAGAEAGGDGAVGTDAAFRNLAGDGVDEVEEGVFFLTGGFDGPGFFARPPVIFFRSRHYFDVVLLIGTGAVRGQVRN